MAKAQAYLFVVVRTVSQMAIDLSIYQLSATLVIFSLLLTLWLIFPLLTVYKLLPIGGQRGIEVFGLNICRSLYISNYRDLYCFVWETADNVMLVPICLHSFHSNRLTIMLPLGRKTALLYLDLQTFSFLLFLLI